MQAEVETAAELRPFRNEDAAGVTALLRELVPEFIVTEPLLEHWIATIPERAQARQWVADRDGDVVGWGEAAFRWYAAEPGIGRLWVGVREDARERGIGSRLYELAETHLVEHGAWKLNSWSREQGAGRRFAERRGFAHARTERLSTLDVRGADLSELPALEAEKRREGFRVVRLEDVRELRRELYAVWLEAAADTPRDDPLGDVNFEEWEAEALHNPLLDFELSSVVLHSARPVAFAWLTADRHGSRAENEFTGTAREFRGRGLARLAKLVATRWCRDAGIRTLLTGNDSTNAPMLAINARLGYRPTITRAELSKELR